MIPLNAYLWFLPLVGKGVKWPCHKFDHGPPSRAKVKNEWIYTFTPATCLHGLHSKNFTR